MGSSPESRFLGWLGVLDHRIVPKKIKAMNGGKGDGALDPDVAVEVIHVLAHPEVAIGNISASCQHFFVIDDEKLSMILKSVLMRVVVVMMMRMTIHILTIA